MWREIARKDVNGWVGHLSIPKDAWKIPAKKVQVKAS